MQTSLYACKVSMTSPKLIQKNCWQTFLIKILFFASKRTNNGLIGVQLCWTSIGTNWAHWLWQLVEPSLRNQRTRVRIQSLAIFIKEYLLSPVEKTKNKEKEAGNGPFANNHHHSFVIRLPTCATSIFGYIYIPIVTK